MIMTLDITYHADMINKDFFLDIFSKIFLMIMVHKWGGRREEDCILSDCI